MIFKIMFDNLDNIISAEIWAELTKIPPSEIDAHPNGYRFDSYGWVNAESEEEALEKAKQMDNL